MLIKHRKQAEGDDAGGGLMEELNAVLDARDDMKPSEDAEPPEDAQESKHDETSVNETVSVSDGDETNEPNEMTDWVTESIQEKAAAYDITSEVLAEMESEEELHSHISFMDKYQESKRQAPQAAPPAAADPKSEPSSEDAGEDPKAWADIISDMEEDGENTDAIQRLYDELQHSRAQMNGMNESLQEYQQAATSQKDLDIERQIDKLGHAEIFGTSKKFTPEQSQNASQVRETINSFINQGRELTPALIQRAVNLNFGSQIVKQSNDKKTGRLQAQSKNVRTKGSSAASKNDAPPLDREDAGDDPFLHQAWANMKREQTGLG